MDRRGFLRYSTLGAFSLAFGNLLSCAQSPPTSTDLKVSLKGIRVIDAHAHPDRYLRQSGRIDTTSTLEAMKTLGMDASCFAAVGDSVFLSQGRTSGTEYAYTKTQLEWWLKGIARSGQVKLVMKASDVPNTIGPDSPPGAILAIEGGDPLEGNPDRVNDFYRFGVRMITVVHYRNNELGDIMKMSRNLDPGPAKNGLTWAGRKVVERMQDLGMVVDVAHAHTNTLRQIAEISKRPLVDSHTNPCNIDAPSRCGRFRTWKDMELVAKTGGVVCTWPLGYKAKSRSRVTFLDWAKEILEMKKRLGMENVGLGTDGGGHLPGLIEGYRDVRDLVKLARAMEEIGFSQDEISAYMGGNFYRLLKICIG
jgi:microsomal dipeptidase-like Zn-dependent dipeptidase